jgi:hypothetical protein
MQSYSTGTLADHIATIILQQQEPAILKLFNNNPDEMFANAEAAFLLYQQVEENTQLLLERLSFQYVADKTREKQWDKLVTFYLSAARYHVKQTKHSVARTEYEKTLFYLNKYHADYATTGNLPEELTIQKEFALCCQTEIELMPYGPSAKMPKWDFCNNRVNHLNQAIYVLSLIADTTKDEHDLHMLAQYRMSIAEVYMDLGMYFADLADKDMSKKKENLMTLIDLTHALALNYFRQAINSIQLVPGRETIRSTYELLFNHYQTLRDKKPPHHRISKPMELTNHLAVLAENRNTPLSEINALLAHPEYDKTEKISYWEMVPKGKSYSNRDAYPSNWSIGSGSLAIVKTLLEDPNDESWLFPTMNYKGLIEELNQFTPPDVLEYLTTPNRYFYRKATQQPLIDFFLDALAGRLDKVKEYLDADPEAIIKVPEIYNDNNETLAQTVLHMAHLTDQRHVMWFLDNYIISYVYKFKDIEKIQTLRKIYDSMMSCYQSYGFTTRRLKVTRDLKISMLNLLDKALAELTNKPEEQISDDELKSISQYNYTILLIKITDARKSHYDASNCTDGNQISLLIETKEKYDNIAEKILTLDPTHLPGDFVEVCQTLMHNQEQISSDLEKIYAGLENESLSSETKSDDEDEKNEVAGKEEKKVGENRPSPTTRTSNYSIPSNSLFPPLPDMNGLISPLDVPFSMQSLSNSTVPRLFHHPNPAPTPLSQPTQSTNPDLSADNTRTLPTTEQRPRMT